MANFSKRNDPKVINNLSSNHATVSDSNRPLYKPQTFERKDSSSFHQEKILYQSNNNLVPDYEKYRKRKVEMPKEEFTEEKKLPRPIADKDAHLKIEKKEVENLSFSKSAQIDNMQFSNDENPVNQVFQSAKTSSEDIIFNSDEVVKPKRKNNWKKKIMPFIIAGVLLEVLIIYILAIFKHFGKIDVLECSQESFNEFYNATITTTKKYTFKNGKITKLLDTTYYKFNDKKTYESFKKEYAYPEYSVIKGRIISFNINDNDNIYEEKVTYDYNVLRKNDTSEDKHTIVVTSDNDIIDLIDYNLKDIKIIYSDDYTCR